MVDQLPEDFVTELLEAFKACVVNKNDGTVSVGRLRDVVSSLGYPTGEAELEEMKREVDPAGTGHFSFVEFVDMSVWKYWDRYPEKDVIDVFREFDRGYTGFISVSDLRTALQSLDLTAADTDSVLHETGFEGQETINYEDFYRKAISL